MKRGARGEKGDLAERLYRLLMLSYPAEFRAACAQDAAEVFGDLHREERANGGSIAVLKLWGRTFFQTFSGAARERWPALEQSHAGRAERGATPSVSASRAVGKLSPVRPPQGTSGVLWRGPPRSQR
jgi:hypothetical protein